MPAKRRYTKHRPWTPEDDALLASAPSGRAAAKLLGRPLPAIWYRRKQLGVHRVPIRFAKRDLLRLPDGALAAKYRCSEATVRRARFEAGILRKAPGRRWNAKEDRLLLREKSNIAAAKLLDRSAQSVTHRRKQLGIEYRGARPRIKFAVRDLKLLSDAEIAVKYSCSVRYAEASRLRAGIKRRAFKSSKVTRELLSDMLPRMSASDAARTLGVSPQAVSAARKRFGIPTTRKTRQTK